MENLYLAVSDTSGTVWLTRIDQNTGNATGRLHKILIPPEHHSYFVIGMAYNAKMDTMYLSIHDGRTNIPIAPRWNLYAINRFTHCLRDPSRLIPHLILTSDILIRGIAYNNNTIYGINNNNIVYLIDTRFPSSDLNNSITLNSTSANFGNPINLAIFDKTLYTFETPNGITSLFSFDIDGKNGDNKQIIGYPNNYNYIFSNPGVYSLTSNKNGKLFGVYMDTSESLPGQMFLFKYVDSSPFVITQISSSPIINDEIFQGRAGALAFVPSYSSSTGITFNKHNKCQM